MSRKPMVNTKASELLKELSLGAVMEFYPREIVEKSLDVTGTNSVRRRILPMFVVVYLVVLMAFYSEVSVRENLRILLESLRRRFGLGVVKIAVGSAISKARRKLGIAPFAHLFEACARPFGSPEIEGCYWRGFRLVAVDGSSVDLQNTEENRKRFGMHKNQYGEVGYPQLKLVALTECGTHASFGLSYGRGNDSEGALFDPLIDKLEANMLLLADRYYYSFTRWKACCKRECALVWRIKRNIKLKTIEVFDDGSYLARIKPSDKLIKKGLCSAKERLTVRVIEYEVQFEDGSHSESVRLITTLTDPETAPAEELARLYAERWNVETGFDEIKTHLRGKDKVLRSQLPELVVQELYGFFLTHFVVRKVMMDAACKAGIAPVEISFVHTVRVIKRKLSFPPSAQNANV